MIYFYFGVLHLILALAYLITNCRLLVLLKIYLSELYVQNASPIKLITVVYSSSLFIRAIYDAFICTFLNFPNEQNSKYAELIIFFILELPPLIAAKYFRVPKVEVSSLLLQLE